MTTTKNHGLPRASVVSMVQSRSPLPEFESGFHVKVCLCRAAASLNVSASRAPAAQRWSILDWTLAVSLGDWIRGARVLCP